MGTLTKKERWGSSSSNSKLREQIEAKMMELNTADLPTITDYRVLQARWNYSSFNSKLEKQIEARMMELNTADLPTITDYNVLRVRWYSSSSDSKLREQIEAKMLELLSLISDTNKPEEFVTLVKATVFKNLPEFFKQPLKEKINSLVK